VSKTSLKNSHTINSIATRKTLFNLCIAGLLALLSSGCAPKQWSDPLKEDPLEASKMEVAGYLTKYEQCGNTLGADLELFYKNPMEQRALEGYLAFSLPKAYKFIVSNPFGQPLLAITGNSKTFEVLLTRETQYIAGSLESYAIRNKLPVEFMKGDWGAWLMAQTHYTTGQIYEIREDEQQRGLWVFWRPADRYQPWESILFERESGKILERLLYNHKNKTIARINYNNWQTMPETKCEQPLSVVVSDLGYGTEIEIKLKDVELRPEKNTYDLTPPNGYFKKYMP